MRLLVMSIALAESASGAPSADDYLRWLKSEVNNALSEVFAGVNENFASVALEGVLHMLRGHDSIDLDTLQRVASVCGTTAFPAPRDVKKTLRVIAEVWWRTLGYREALSIARTKLREVSKVHLVLFH
jgi:hypothetical protein